LIFCYFLNFVFDKYYINDDYFHQLNILKKKDMSIQDLVKISSKKLFYLQIIEMKYREGKILGFLFKITEIKRKKDNKSKNEIFTKMQMSHDKNEIIFDLLKLNYIRTLLVTYKSGLRNLREREINRNSIIELNSGKKRKRDKRRESIEDFSEEGAKYILTKDKILEVQGKDSEEVKTFIYILDFYGSDISLVRHRPNKEKYPCGKDQEPLIKINLSTFAKRIETNLKQNPNFFQRINKKQNEKIEENNEKNEINSISTTKQNENNKKENKKINTNFISDSYMSLMNIFKVKSIKTIKYIDFFIYIFINLEK